MRTVLATTLFTVKKSRGFTLIELSVVLFILILLMGIVVPNFSLFKKEKLKSTARKLAGFIRGVRAETMFSLNAIRLHINFEDKLIQSEMCVPVEEGVCEWQKIETRNAKFEIPDDVILEDISVFGDKVSTGELFIPFTNTGLTPPVAFHLKSGTKQMTVSINPITGKAKIIEGYEDIVEYQEE